MRLGILAMQAVAIVWMVSLFGFFIETAHRAPHLAGGGLLLLIADTQIFFHRTSGVCLPPLNQ